jgi:hypothetical protein
VSAATVGHVPAVASLAVDHLVVACATLEEGVAWCGSTLGASPDPGGRHARFATHNRLVDVSTAAHPRCYLEVIAIDPSAASPSQPRWFALDEAPLARLLARDGPRLVAWVARVEPGHAADAIAAAWRTAGSDPGPLIAVERATPRGWLRWRLSVRPDGRRLLGGALPGLIAWGDLHPSASLTPKGVSLVSMVVRGLPEPVQAPLADAVQAGPGAPGMPALTVTLDTPKGRVVLESPREPLA